MYTPAQFKVSDLPTLHADMERWNFATLITPDADGGPQVTHLPLLLDRDGGHFGVLAGHMAKANPHWRAFSRSVESLAIFHGPHGYISPRWYDSEIAVPHLELRSGARLRHAAAGGRDRRHGGAPECAHPPPRRNGDGGLAVRHAAGRHVWGIAERGHVFRDAHRANRGQGETGTEPVTRRRPGRHTGVASDRMVRRTAS